MTETEALQIVRRLAQSQTPRIEGDVNWAMGATGTSVEDIRYALQNAHACVASGPRWHVSGPALNEAPLLVIVRIDRGIIDVDGLEET